MIQLTIDMPEGALAALHQDPLQFVRELRLAAAVKWYEMRRISQGRAAEIAGVSRSEFITALSQFGVSPFRRRPPRSLRRLSVRNVWVVNTSLVITVKPGNTVGFACPWEREASGPLRKQARRLHSQENLRGERALRRDAGGCMSVSAYIHRRLVDLLEESRVVVWYDGEGLMRALAMQFTAPNCQLVDTSESTLKSRREADRIFRGLNDPDNATLKNQNLLIYCPRRRGRTDEQRCEDPFEVFAVFGAVFGDKESESLQSLARQAMPERAAEIDRLFAAGHPTLSMLDNLQAGQSFPLLQDCLGSDAPLDVAAQVLCVPGTVAKIAATSGVMDELLRLLHNEYGYAPPPRASKVEPRLEPFAPYVLLSEFAFDLGEPLPDALASTPVAPVQHKDRIFALCDRMRRSNDTREGYIDLAQRLEAQLRMRDIFRDYDKLGSRDTFPFEERHYLHHVQSSGRGRQAGRRPQGHRGTAWLCVVHAGRAGRVVESRRALRRVPRSRRDVQSLSGR